MKRYLRSYTFAWWQLALYELALVSLGLGVGTLWYEALQPAVPWLLLIFILVAPYILYLYLDQSSVPGSETSEPKGKNGSKKES
ncbi:MAG: hypothetical protein WDZ79_00835 [Candidatus Paceibacterota bacterium]